MNMKPTHRREAMEEVEDGHLVALRLHLLACDGRQPAELRRDERERLLSWGLDWIGVVVRVGRSEPTIGRVVNARTHACAQAHTRRMGELKGASGA
jgi:hypothetical protein